MNRSWAPFVRNIFSLILAMLALFPLAGTVGAAPPGGKTMWHGTMEHGMSDWYGPRGPGWTSGGEFNSDGGESAATEVAAHSGEASAALSLPRGSGGVRLFRWRELREARTTVQSAWLYIPSDIKLLNNPLPWWNLMQIVSRPAEGPVRPFWHINVTRTKSGEMALSLVWWQQDLEGPYPGEHGYQQFRQQVVTVPTDKWFKLTMAVRQSSDFDGSIAVWQGRRMLFSFIGVRTSYENCNFTEWCAANEWSVNNYSGGIAPAPATIFVDDARIGKLTAPRLNKRIRASLSQQR